MGLFGALIGNSGETNKEEIAKKYYFIIGEGENIEAAYKLIRDVIIFTDKRLIIIDVQGVTGKKVEYKSIPYRSIIQFSIESTGHFDLEAELRIWVQGQEQPLKKEFGKDSNIYEVQAILAAATCK